MQTYSKIKESIKNNSEIVSDELHILGNVEENSIVETSRLQIDGTTEEYSTQYSRFANINVHKGTLRCHEASIKNLDGGEIHATKVDVVTCNGGFIYAQDVHIESILKPVTIIASHSITVGSVSVADSLFKINYKEVPIINSKLDLIQDDLEQLKEELEDAKKHNIAQLSNIEHKIDTLQTEYQTILDAYKIATITLNGTVAQGNQITFTLNTDNEITYVTQEQSYAPFHLNITASNTSLLPIATL